MGSSIWKGKCYVNKMPSAHPTPHCRPWFYMLARVRTTREELFYMLARVRILASLVAVTFGSSSEVKCLYCSTCWQE